MLIARASKHAFHYCDKQETAPISDAVCYVFLFPFFVAYGVGKFAFHILNTPSLPEVNTRTLLSTRTEKWVLYSTGDPDPAWTRLDSVEEGQFSILLSGTSQGHNVIYRKLCINLDHPRYHILEIQENLKTAKTLRENAPETGRRV